MKTKILTIIFISLPLYLNAGIGAGSSSVGALPVELTTFTATATANNIQLNWTTATEVNNYGFEILRQARLPEGKAQNDRWSLLGFVEGHGNSSSPKEYSFVDESVFPGLYRYRLKQIDTDGSFEYSEIIEVQFGVVPTEYVLAQNYPNPFNPSTTIRFSLPVTSNVNLSVFNILGEVVQVLVNETKEAGVHIINFNASQLNSGVYFYKIWVYPANSGAVNPESSSPKGQAGQGFIAIKKMLLLK